MPELLLELFGEEIPARMQAQAAEDLGRLVGEALAALQPESVRLFHGPRRIAAAASVRSATQAVRQSERGPRRNAPEQALAGFLRKHNAESSQLVAEGEHWVLHRHSEAESAATLLTRTIPPLLRRFPWPKSMRWGGTSAFAWIRPLRRLLCVLDGTVVPFSLRDGDDDGHGLAAGNLTEGHRFLSPGPFAVHGLADWLDGLRQRSVIADAAERRAAIVNGLARCATDAGLAIADDPNLLEEVTGLVEWPVVMLGRIDDEFMDLPAEVMQVSMRTNQRYFALRNPDGTPAARFAFVANIDAADQGATIIAGNERVLRARFADARHFWRADLRTSLAKRLPALADVTFHARLGSQSDRVARLERLAAWLAPMSGAPPHLARRAAQLAKADLTTGMVGEFPELQGVIGGYYAQHDAEPAAVAAAIRDHYRPRGPGDPVPDAPVSVTVALADRLDQLAGFFGIGERPSGAGDPFALRRAALGIIRIIRENNLRLPLRPAIAAAAEPLAEPPDPGELLAFLVERLRIQLRTEGTRHDVLAAVFAAGADDDLVRLLARSAAVTALLGSEDGRNLLAAYRRAANILRIEDARDGPHEGEPDGALLHLPAERDLWAALAASQSTISGFIAREDFVAAMAVMAALRQPVDEFFLHVIVNDTVSELRANRLRLLARLRDIMNLVADFAKLEG